MIGSAVKFLFWTVLLAALWNEPAAADSTGDLPAGADKVLVEYHFNPFCGPSQQSLHYVIGPLYELLSNQSAVDFRLIPLQLGQKSFEGRAVAALLCQKERRGVFPALAAVAAEARDSMERGDPEKQLYSWDRYRPADPCYDLEPFRQLAERQKAALKSKGEIYTPALFIDGIEVSPFDLVKVREHLAAARHKRR